MDKRLIGKWYIEPNTCRYKSGEQCIKKEKKKTGEKPWSFPHFSKA